MAVQRPVQAGQVAKPVDAQAKLASESKAKVARLNALQDAANDVSQKNSRLTGEANTLHKRLDEISGKCKAEFDSSVEELPGLVQQLNEEFDTRTANAEAILGLNQAASG